MSLSVNRSSGRSSGGTATPSDGLEYDLMTPTSYSKTAFDESTPLIERLADKYTGSATTFNTFFVYLKAFIGSGLFGMAYGFSQAGVWPAIATLYFVCILSGYCFSLLLVTKRKIMWQLVEDGDTDFECTYENVGLYLFGRAGRIGVLSALVFTQIGFSAAYVIFIGKNMSRLHPEISFFAYVAMLVIPLLLICYVRSVNFIAPTSAFGLACMGFTVMMILIWTGKNHMHGVSWDDVNATHMETFPIFFGIALYAFEGIGLIIPLEKQMSHPAQFPKIIWGTNFIGATLLTILGTVGYLGFGDQTDGIVLLNLPTSLVIVKISMIALMVALYFTFPVQMIPVFQIFEEVFKVVPNTPNYWRKFIAVRTACSLVAIGLACAIPHFGLFLSVIGSLGSSCMAFIFPTAMYVKAHWGEMSKKSRVFHFCIITFGIGAGLFSLSIALKQLIHVFEYGSSTASSSVSTGSALFSF